MTRINIAGVGEFDNSWQARANCMGEDPTLFFPERWQASGKANEACGSCAVRQECLDYATANGDRIGVWAQVRENDPRRLRRVEMMLSPLIQ